MTEAAARLFEGDLISLDSAVGVTFGPSAPMTITQARIEAFAEATDDHQWIHVDAERAADGPFGTTIAHGYLTLSLVPRFLAELVDVTGVGMGINYGLNKVRFPAAVPSGSIIRGSVAVASIQRSAAGAQVTFDVRISADRVDKPVCVAQVVVLYAT